MPMPNQNPVPNAGNAQHLPTAIHFEGACDARTGEIQYRILDIHGSIGSLACLSAAITAEVLNAYMTSFGNAEPEELCEKYVEDFLMPLVESIHERKAPSKLNMARITVDVRGAIKQALEERKNKESEDNA